MFSHKELMELISTLLTVTQIELSLEQLMISDLFVSTSSLLLKLLKTVADYQATLSISLE